MGFWSKLVRKIKGDDTLLLESGKKEDTRINITPNNNELKVDGRFIDGNLQMTAVMQGKQMVIGQWDERRDKDTNPRESILSVKEAFDKLKNANHSEIEDAKQNIIQLIKEIGEDDICFKLNPQCIDVIDNYYTQILDYSLLEKKLPKKIDWDKVSIEEKMEIGRQAQNRLNSLSKIKDINDVKSDKKNIINFMATNENVPTNPIVDANIESKEQGIKLDEETLKQIARNMDAIPNEDSALYSVYLKLEEKRIWKQMQNRILEYDKQVENKEPIKDIYNLSEKIRLIDGCQLPDKSAEFSYELLDFIIREMRELNIENYITNIKEKDLELAQKINSMCPDIQDKTQILYFLYARIGSFGQLYCRSSGTNKELLRDFVANTEFKDEEATESLQFLLLVARIEEQHIKSKFAPAIEIYNQRTNQNETLKSKLEVGYTPTINRDKDNIEDKSIERNKPFQREQ